MKHRRACPRRGTGYYEQVREPVEELVREPVQELVRKPVKEQVLLLVQC